MLHTDALKWPFALWRKRTVSATGAGWVALAICIVASGTGSPLAKILSGSLSPLSLLFFNEFLTGFFVVLSFGLMPMLKEFSKLKRKDLLCIGVIGITSGTIAPLFLFTGLQNSTAVNASLLSGMEPLFMLIFAAFVLREPLRNEHWLSVLIMIFGMIVIALQGFTNGFLPREGDILLVLTGATFAVGSITFRKYLQHAKPHVVLFGRNLVAVSCFFLMSPFTNHTLAADILQMPLTLLPILLLFGFVSRFLTIFSFYQSLDRLAVGTVSLLLNLSVITSIIFSTMILGESVHWYHILGGSLIIFGAALLELRGLHPTPAHLEKHLRQRNVHR